MATNAEICALSGTEQARLIKQKELSPVEVVGAVYERIHLLNPILNAFCTLVEDEAKADAKKAEAAVLRGDELGALHGVPVSIKDLVCTKGIRTVSGSKGYIDFIPDEDDIVMERLRGVGAIILGKTNVPEFGYMGATHNDVFGTTRNPWNLEKTPGGSSGGGTAAVASGMGSLAIGSDGGGSVRIPSSFSGLFAMKASFGRVPLYPGCRDPRYPGVSSWESLEHIGPMTRTVEDSALMLSVIASGPDDRDRHSLPGPEFNWLEAMKGDLKGAKVAFSPDWGFARVDPQVRKVTEAAVKVFGEKLGCEIEIAHPGFDNMEDAFWTLVFRDSDLRGMRAMMERGEITLPSLVAVLKRPWTAEEFTDAHMARQDMVNKMWKFMRKYDFLLTPTLAVPPFELNIPGPSVIDGEPVGPAHWLSFTFPINMTGQPAATVPAGFTDDGLPVGLQIVGKHLDDVTVLKAAANFEAASPWKQYWPPLLDAVLS